MDQSRQTEQECMFNVVWAGAHTRGVSISKEAGVTTTMRATRMMERPLCE